MPAIDLRVAMLSIEHVLRKYEKYALHLDKLKQKAATIHCSDNCINIIVFLSIHISQKLAGKCSFMAIE